MIMCWSMLKVARNGHRVYCPVPKKWRRGTTTEKEHIRLRAHLAEQLKAHRQGGIGLSQKLSLMNLTVILASGGALMATTFLLYKRFLSEVQQGRVPQTFWSYEEVGHTQEAKKELISTVNFPNSDAVFETPKPTRLIHRMLQLATKPDDSSLVLDFFAGSGSTLHGVLSQNAADGGNRRCILVQLPEPLPNTENGSLTTIAEITK